MSEPGHACAISDEAKFQSLSAGARPFTRSEEAAFLDELDEARRRETRARDDDETNLLASRRASFDKWRLIHAWARRHPYRDPARGSRSAQWRAALEKFRALREPELIDWLALQIEVAGNLEAGVADMRPRDPGPTWLVGLEYVANRKRKALAILHWAEAAEKEGCATVDSAWHARSAAILGGEPAAFDRGAGGHEGMPFIVDDDG